MPIKIRFHDCFNVYNILIDEEINWKKNEAGKNMRHIYKWQFFNFTVNELSKFCNLLKINTRYCVLHVTLFWFATFIHTYTCGRPHTHRRTQKQTHIHRHTHIHTHAHTHTHTHTCTHTHTHTHTQTHTHYNFLFFGKITKMTHDLTLKLMLVFFSYKTFRWLW